MAQKIEDNVNEGYELVRNAFAEAPTDVQRVITLISESGLEFLVSEPSKIWKKEVHEFFTSASVDSDILKIKSTVHGSTVKITPRRLRKILQLPIIENEEEVPASKSREALQWCGLDPTLKIGAAFNRKGMNQQGKFLSEVVGKVILCKPGGHDRISAYMFCLMTRIVFTIPTDWSAVIFEKIKEGIKKPNLARIMSLYLTGVIPEVMQHLPGTKINHMRKMDMRLFSRWDRVLSKDVPDESRLDTPVKSSSHAQDTEQLQEEQERKQDEDHPVSTPAQQDTIPAQMQGEQAHSPAQIVSTPDQVQGEQVYSPAQDITNTEQAQGEKISDPAQEAVQIDISKDLNIEELIDTSSVQTQKEYTLDELFPNVDMATDRVEEGQEIEKAFDMEIEIEKEQIVEGESVHVEAEQHGTETNIPPPPPQERVQVDSSSDSETEEARMAKKRKLVVFKRRSKGYKQALQTTTQPSHSEFNYNKFMVDLQVKLDDHRVAVEKYVDESNKALQFDLAQDIKSIRFEVNMHKKEMTDCFHKGGNAVVFLAKQQQSVITKADDIALKQGYVLTNQINMNANLEDSHNEILNELKKTTEGLPAARAKEMEEFDKTFQAAIESVKTAITTSQKDISDKLQKLKPFFKEGVNYLDGQIRFQKEDLRDHITREAIKGERLLVHAGSEHTKWVTNSIRATLGYPPLCDDAMVAESGIQTGLLEGNQPEVAQVIYPPPDFDMIDQQVQEMYSPPKEVNRVVIEKVDKPEATLKEQQDALLSKKRFREQAELKPDFEQWSPTSRNIILTAWKAVKDQVHERGKWYNEIEWQKHEARQEAIVQFRRNAKLGRLPPDAQEPSKYFPKPYHYFERQRLKEEAKKKADQKGKKLAEDVEAPVKAQIQSGKGIQLRQTPAEDSRKSSSLRRIKIRSQIYTKHIIVQKPCHPGFTIMLHNLRLLYLRGFLLKRKTVRWIPISPPDHCSRRSTSTTKKIQLESFSSLVLESRLFRVPIQFSCLDPVCNSSRLPVVYPVPQVPVAAPVVNAVISLEGGAQSERKPSKGDSRSPQARRLQAHASEASDALGEQDQWLARLASGSTFSLFPGSNRADRIGIRGICGLIQSSPSSASFFGHELPSSSSAREMGVRDLGSPESAREPPGLATRGQPTCSRQNWISGSGDPIQVASLPAQAIRALTGSRPVGWRADSEAKKPVHNSGVALLADPVWLHIAIQNSGGHKACRPLFSWQSFVETLVYRCCSCKREVAGLSPSLCRPSKA
ncbi:hypothetical protein KSP39_PZI002087 [Platanthera zijinensis]|uniref:Uncharacterized protein n=1 Tax=Platanthera zijinensis TaxID=2320716 RepID=A0AAP0BZZ0_9ASPA